MTETVERALDVCQEIVKGINPGLHFKEDDKNNQFWILYCDEQKLGEGRDNEWLRLTPEEEVLLCSVRVGSTRGVEQWMRKVSQLPAPKFKPLNTKPGSHKSHRVRFSESEKPFKAHRDFLTALFAECFNCALQEYPSIAAVVGSTGKWSRGAGFKAGKTGGATNSWKPEEHLKLRDGYRFLTSKGLKKEVDRIKRSGPWTKEGYDDRMKRGLMVEVMKRHELLNEFCDSHWRWGSTREGLRKIDFYVEFYNQHRTEGSEEISRSNIRDEPSGTKARAGQERSGSPIPPADDGYLRATKAELKYIRRGHATLGRQFREWLTDNGYSDVFFEKSNVDIEFTKDGQLFRAELKVCGSLSTTKALREAIGQLLEYNYYGSRGLAKYWFIVLDMEPSEVDRSYVGKLRSVFRMPLSLYWPDAASGFVSDSVSPRSADNAAPAKDN